MLTAGSPWSTGSLAARGDVRALPAAWPPCHTLPARCHPGPTEGGSVNIQTESWINRWAGASEGPARGHRKHRQLPDEAQNSRLRGRGVWDPPGQRGGHSSLRSQQVPMQG